MSSCIQILIRILPSAKIIKHEFVCCEHISLFLSQTSKNNKIITREDQQEFMINFFEIFEKFKSGRQEDFSEVFTSLITYLSNFISFDSLKTSRRKIFECKSSTMLGENFHSNEIGFQLSFPEGESKSINLGELFDHYFEQEKAVDWNCGIDKCENNFQEFIYLENMPKDLFLFLNRNVFYVKNQCYVNFKLTDFEVFGSGEIFCYDLNAFVCHHGEEFDSGK